MTKSEALKFKGLRPGAGLWSLNSCVTSDSALDLSGPLPPLSQEDGSEDLMR